MKTLRFRTLAIILLPAAALLTLGTACSGPVATLGIGGHGSTAFALPAPPPSAQESGVRQIHSPGAVAVDENLAPGQCAARVVDAAAGDVLPDPGCTPGAIDPAVSEDNIDSTICKAGYTATIRPPASATDKFKTTSLSAYGQSYERTTELDHRLSAAVTRRSVALPVHSVSGMPMSGAVL
ncbi:hypothetical protein [Arthrobacter sp. MA-N2]|uniref:hypothetical protein n=1 Tax=Arthrobacter sp. MA-N2 TaxID=1101188 RepID=UPI0004AF5CDF|nr:hypothetical protein [Arthrobacter sp. MA-N2]